VKRVATIGASGDRERDWQVQSRVMRVATIRASRLITRCGTQVVIPGVQWVVSFTRVFVGGH